MKETSKLEVYLNNLMYLPVKQGCPTHGPWVKKMYCCIKSII